MPYENIRKTRLIKEALGGEEACPPSVAQTCWTIGLIAAAVVIIALAGIDLPAQTAYVMPSGPQHAAVSTDIVLSMPIGATDSTPQFPAPEAKNAPSENGNVVDMTF